jgi:phosphoglycerate kinase
MSSLLTRVDLLVIGGALANTFLKAEGHVIGEKSFYEKEALGLARQILDTAAARKVQIFLPVDSRGLCSGDENSAMFEAPLSETPSQGSIRDIGPASTHGIIEALKSVRTVLWNGPVGLFEQPPFDQGSLDLAKFLGTQTKAGLCTTIAGGGETVAVLARAGVIEDFSYVSTAGGAFLEYLEGDSLPGICALRQAPYRKAD